MCEYVIYMYLFAYIFNTPVKRKYLVTYGYAPAFYFFLKSVDITRINQTS